MKIPFAKPHFSEEDVSEILTSVRSVLASGWLTSGSIVQDLESQFARLLGDMHCIAVNSCTAALHSILMSLGVGPRDEVIVPSNTFVATANAVLYVGAEPVFADCDDKTFNVSPLDVIGKISHKTKAIIVVHLAGNPCDMSRFEAIANDRHIAIIEDCAHALGSKWRSKYCGTFGTASAFSFYATKVVTSGEGGMIATKDIRVAEKCKLIRNQGRGGYGPLEIQSLGYSFRMPDLLALIARNQLQHLDEFIRKRNQIAAKYTAGLRDISWIRPQCVEKDAFSSYCAYIVELVDAPLNRDKFAELLAKDGVGTSVLYHPIHLQPFYRRIFQHKPSMLPVAERLGARSLALPLFSGMRDEAVDFILESIHKISRPS